MAYRKPYFPKTRKLGALVDAVAKPCLKNGGYYFAQLMLDWEKIIGYEMALNTAPLKLTFPKGKGTSAMLTLQVEPAFALMVGFQKGLIIEKIAGFYGKRLVSDILFKQAPITRAPTLEPKQIKKSHNPLPSDLEKELADITDETLRRALMGLGLQIYNT